MGNSKSVSLSKDLLEELKLNTKYSEEQLCTGYLELTILVKINTLYREKGVI